MTGKVSPQSGDASINGAARAQLQGWIPTLASPEDIRLALDKAFDYRGDVSITLREGRTVEGYVFDRKSESPSLDECLVRMFPKDGGPKMSIRYSDIVRLEFSGRDTAAGKTFELWVKRYNERKARGEKGISLEPEPLD